MPVRHRKGIKQHAAPAVRLQRAELLQQSAVRGLGVAHRKNRVGGMGSGDIRDIDDAHMAQEHALGLVAIRDRLELGAQTKPERMRQRHHRQHIGCGNDGERGRTTIDDVDDLVDFLLAAFHQSRRHGRHSRRIGDEMVFEPALELLTDHIVRQRAITFRLQKVIQPGSTGQRTIGDFHAWQQVDQMPYAFGSDRLPVRDDDDLLGPADDAEQFDGRNMRARVDDRHIGQRNGIGDRGQRRGRRHQNRLRRGEDLRVLAVQTIQGNLMGPHQRRVQQIGFLCTGEQHVA